MATAQNNLRYVQNQSRHSQLILKDEMTGFEQMKIDDIKLFQFLSNFPQKYFSDFVLIELAFHGRALEYDTNAHRHLQVNEKEKEKPTKKTRRIVC